MSETDSFVEEVTEEIRRDRLYRVFRKYGWLIVLALVLIVGGAIFNEWRKSRAESARQVSGDALMAAITQDSADARAKAFGALGGTDDPSAHLAQFGHAAALVENGDEAAAIEVFDTIAANESLSDTYRDLARLKILMLDPQASDADQLLELLVQPGRPFSLLALELRATIHIASGDTDGAIADLTSVLEAPLTSPELRQRAQQLIIVLGGEIPQSSVLLPSNEDE